MTRTTEHQTRMTASTGCMKTRSLVLFALAALLGAGDANARTWTQADQETWERAWLSTDAKRAAMTSNNFRLAKYEEELGEKAKEVAVGDELCEWVGVVSSIELSQVRGLGECVVGEVKLSDPVVKSPHVVRFVELRKDLSTQLEGDLSAVRRGELVSVTGVVRPALFAAPKQAAKGANAGFFAKCWAVWRAVLGAREAAAPKPARTKPVELRKLFGPASDTGATLYVTLQRIDPSWSPGRRAAYERALRVGEEVKEVLERRRQLQGKLSAVRFAPESVSLAGSGLERTLVEDAPQVRFRVLECDADYGQVRVHLPWEKLPDLSDLLETVQGLAARASQERFYNPAPTLRKLEDGLRATYSQVAAGEADEARLVRWAKQYGAMAAEEAPLQAMGGEEGGAAQGLFLVRTAGQ